jgi:hypothetical protein
MRSFFTAYTEEVKILPQPVAELDGVNLPRPVAVEIKSATSPGEKEVVGLKAFKSDNPSARVMCFCQIPFAYRKGGNEFVPWQKGLKELFS